MENTLEARPVKHILWGNVLFFTFTGLVTLVGGPLYVSRAGMPSSLLALALFFTVATGMSITVGYHRLFSHLTFKTNPVIQFFMLFFGAAAFEMSALEWSSQHRDHHRYVDTDKDPYNIKKGFFYAHIGWMLRDGRHIDLNNVPDLRKSRLVMHQHENYVLWAVVSGVLLPTAVGALLGHALGAFIFAVCARIALVHHATFCINSVCHLFGKATYDIYSTAKDHWLVAFITNGEGYHNFHHRFSTDFRNGVRWYQWDPSKWFIATLAAVGLAWDLKTVSRFKILEARVSAEQQRVSDWILKHHEPSRWQDVLTALEARHKVLLEQLARCEALSKEYRQAVNERVRRELAQAKEKFAHERAQWRAIVTSHADLSACLT